MNTKELYFLEWSPSQQASHKNPVQKSIEENLKGALTGKVNDWVVIGLFESFEECVKAQWAFDAAMKKTNHE